MPQRQAQHGTAENSDSFVNSSSNATNCGELPTSCLTRVVTSDANESIHREGSRVNRVFKFFSKHSKYYLHVSVWLLKIYLSITLFLMICHMNYDGVKLRLPSIIKAKPTMHWSYIFASLLTHLVFNRFEPRSVKARFGLLFGIPILNAIRIHGFDLPALLAGIGIHNAVLLISLFLYRCNPRHPLATYPGPFFASLSGFWMVYHCSGGKRHVLLMKLHQKYGTHVRIVILGPNMLSIVDIDAVKALLYDPKVPRSSGTRALEPDHMPANMLSSRTISYPDHLKAHAAQRERWSKGFTSAALDDYNIHLNARLFQLIEKFKSLANSRSEVDLAEWFRHFVWDFMGDLVFGGGFSMMEDGEDKSGYRFLVDNALGALTLLIYIPWVNNFLPYLSIFGDSQGKILRFAEKCIIERSRRQLSYKDLVFFFAKEDEPEHVRPPRNAVVNDAFLGIIAGSDSTVNTFTSLFFLLLSHPDTLEKLRDEIDSLDEEELTNLSRLAQLPYLNACIEEALRLVPPLLSQLNRTSTGKLFGERYVPYGTAVFIPNFLLGRDPRYFHPDPTSFWPERWLPERRMANRKIIHNTQAFVPFSAGATACLGKQLAYRELRMGTALLIRNFNMKLVLKDGTVGPPSVDEMLFEKTSDWAAPVFEKGLMSVTFTVISSWEIGIYQYQLPSDTSKQVLQIMRAYA
ncbi:cytochrome P450 [Flagelloscypha sp. PMI_526]|nr:cytochrome P450 [Flagelloscypha sp. PMI_526]